MFSWDALMFYRLGCSFTNISGFSRNPQNLSFLFFINCAVITKKTAFKTIAATQLQRVIMKSKANLPI